MEPPRSATNVGVVKRSAGERAAELKLDPPGYRTVPTPKPTDTAVWDVAGAGRAAATTSSALMQRFTGEEATPASGARIGGKNAQGRSRLRPYTTPWECLLRKGYGR